MAVRRQAKLRPRAIQGRWTVGLAATLLVALALATSSIAPASATLAPERTTSRAAPHVGTKAVLPANDQTHDAGSNCLEWTTAPTAVDATVKAAVCADVVSDLAGIGALLGLPIIAPTSHQLTDPLRIIFAAQPKGATAMNTTYFKAVTNPEHPDRGVIDEPCAITIYPVAWQGEGSGGSAKLRVWLAHETVHCYQNEVFTEQENGSSPDADGNATNQIPDFVLEGSATYLGTLYVGYAEQSTPRDWSSLTQGWLGDPGKDLTARGYDAIGWYSLLAKVNGDLWPKMAKAWRAYISGGASVYIAALGGDTPAVEKAWGPSLVNDAGWGEDWVTPGIGIPDGLSATRVTSTIDATGGSNGRSVSPWSGVVDDESSVPDGIVEVSVVGGFGSIHDEESHDYLGFSDMTFCVGQKACEDTNVTCSTGGPPLQLEPLSSGFTLAVDGEDQGGSYRISSVQSPDDPASSVTLPAADGSCGLPAPGGGPAGQPTAYSTGDPHLKTFGGDEYDFQAAGEFTLVRSTSGDLDVQVRQQPEDGQNDVTWDTAVAMRVGRTSVEVDPGLTAARVLIDGRATTLHSSSVRNLNGGGTAALDATGDVFVTWPDGSKLEVLALPPGEDVLFTPSAARIGHLEGLLTALTEPATVADDHTDTLVGSSGHIYRLNPSTTAGFHTLYGAFADSWRITQSASLFTYSSGKTTRSYDLANFPKPATGFSAGQIAKFTAICTKAGITNKELLIDCAFDVGMTGNGAIARTDARFAASYKVVTSPPVALQKHPVEYFEQHPCALITKSQAETVVAAPVNAGEASTTTGDGQCSYVPTVLSAHSVEFDVGTGAAADRAKEYLSSKATKISEPSVASGAFCLSSSSGAFAGYDAVLFANAEGTSAAPDHVDIEANSCVEAVELAKGAFAVIS
jgi:hypothetical protein